MKTLLIAPLVAISAAVVPLHAAPQLPQVDRADAQPSLLLTHRLIEALDTIGAPLAPEMKRELRKLADEADEEKITQRIQALLDPLCVAAVEIAADGMITATPGIAIEVEEHGWANALVKVVNRAAIQTPLRSESPNAKPIPNGPKDDIPNRWLSLNSYDGRPLDPSLSGLALEYRILQLSSMSAGERKARVEFSMGGKESRVIRKWTFDRDADGWSQPHQAKLEVRDRSLFVQSEGDDPYFSAPVETAGGKFVLRFWGKADGPGGGQVFWWTDKAPQTDGKRQKNFRLTAGAEQEYAVPFQVDGTLKGVRIDPLQGRGTFRFDWITLEAAPPDSGPKAGVDVTIRTVPATEVKFAVRDADGTPCMGAFEIRDARGRVYPAQSKRQAPDFFFQTQIYRETDESIRLPAGTYTVRCSHGPESIPETKTLTVGAEPVTFTYQVKRWIDLAKLGYWSGDHHIHAAGCQHYENPTQGVHPPDMLRHIMGEDVKVGCCLTWGPCFDYQKQFFRGKPDDISRYPYLLRYDIEVSGFGSHLSGHLNLLKLREQIPAGGDSKHHWPTLGMNTLRWAKRQGAVTGPAHSANGLTRIVGRTEGTDGPHKLPGFDLPAFDGIGANEFIMQVTHQVDGPDGTKVPALDFISTMDTERQAEWNIWYHVLNCGIPIVASGETDFPCISGERVGMGRVYVKLPGRLDYDEWVEALCRGESYVSDGTSHLLDFNRNDDGSFSVKAAARSEKPVEVELVVNGYRAAKERISGDGKLQTVRFAAPQFDRSAWVAVRIFPSAHANPIWVLKDGKPVRESASIRWCQAALEQCWKEKQKTYAQAEMEQAVRDYDHARAFYKNLLDEAAR